MHNRFVLIATGNELVVGNRVNTNTSSIAKILHANYFKTDLHLICRDDEQQLINIIKFYAKTHNLILTGGLGPTDDDLTRDVIATVTNRPLQYQSNVAQSVTKYLEAKGIQVQERHHRQFYFPEGSGLFANSNGTAWGFVCKYDSALIYALPGPPSENTLMLNECLEDIKTYIQPEQEIRLHWQVQGTEERIIRVIDNIVAQHKLQVETCAHGNKLCDVRFTLCQSEWPESKISELKLAITNAWGTNELDALDLS